MINNGKFWIALVFIFTILIVGPTFKSDKTPKHHTEKQSAAFDIDEENLQSKQLTLSTKKVDHTTDKNSQALVSSSNLDLETPKPSANKTPWKVREDIDPPIKPNAAVDEIKAIEMENEWQSKFDIGEDIDFPLTDKTVTAQIEAVSEFPNGDQSWTGHLKGYEDEYLVVVTVGKKVSFATVLTPEGEYTVEIVDDIGTVYKTPEVHELSSDDNPDYLIPTDMLH